jgi:hypothetical protein
MPGAQGRAVPFSGQAPTAHRPRISAAREQGHVRHYELASWLPIRAGLTPHKLRHSHRVLLDEVGTPAVLAHDRLGHSMPGIGGTYAHVSPFMRAELRERLQARWETTLDERLAICPGSSVPLVAELLAARHAAGTAAQESEPAQGREPGRVPCRLSCLFLNLERFR